MNDPFDPNQPDEERRSSHYVSRKDVRIAAFVLLFLAVIGWPVYLYLLGGVHTSLCKKNLRKIGTAMLNYVQDFDEHFPYAYQRADFTGNDIAQSNGRAFTWHWQIEQYVGDWKVFHCPAAQESEHSATTDPSGTQVQYSDYGMLDGYSGAGYTDIASPGQKFLISETAKSGARSTFDPLRLSASGVPIADDGFMIGFDNDQTRPNSGTKFASRLAFPNTAKGDFGDDSDARHPAGIHFLFADGHVGVPLSAAAARVIEIGGTYGPWDVPKPPPQVVPRLPSR